MVFAIAAAAVIVGCIFSAALHSPLPKPQPLPSSLLPTHHAILEDTSKICVHGEGNCRRCAIAIALLEACLDVIEEQEWNTTLLLLICQTQVSDSLLHLVVEHIAAHDKKWVSGGWPMRMRVSLWCLRGKIACGVRRLVSCAPGRCSFEGLRGVFVVPPHHDGVRLRSLHMAK